jgi:ADP-heptose:LPS heptosyltransferase
MELRVKQKIDYFAGYALIGLLLPITRLLGITLRRDHSTQAPPRRIVFIKLLGLGSLIVASDAITAMRSRYPQTRFILLTDVNIAAGIAPFHLFDEIHAVRTDRLYPMARDVLRFLLSAWQWRRLWIIDLEVYSKLTTVFALITLARNRFGFYLSPVPFRKYLNTHNIVFDQQAFLEDNYLHMAREVTATQLPEPSPVITHGHLDKPYIILNNTCSDLASERKLPDKTLSEICRWILGNTSYGLALLGMPADKMKIDAMIREDPELNRQQQRIVNYAGKADNFDGYYRFLREEGVCLVTIDSGPLHIAHKLGLPTVSVWGPTDPDNYLKLSPGETRRHLCYYAATPCSPCIHHYHPLPCRGNNFCMRNIPSAVIIEKIKELLGNLD